MATLPFNEGIVEFFFQIRQNDALTPLIQFFQFLTFLGSSTGYFILVLAIYWLYRKDIVYELAVLLVITALSNLALKEIIRNPRPYVVDGTYQQKWALSSPNEIAETANSFSTPSGHAQTAATFFSFLYYKSKSTGWRVLFVFLILGIGISRPFLGVHYLEDVIIGWSIGLLITFLYIKYKDKIPVPNFETSRHSIYAGLFGLTIVLSFGFGFLNEFHQASQDIVTFMGLLMGIVVGFDQERIKVNFDPRASSIANGILRFVIGGAIAFSVLFGLDAFFAEISGDESLLGFALRYVRYFSFGLVSTLVCPWIFVKANLSRSI